MNKFLPLVLCVVLIAAVALFAFGYGGKGDDVTSVEKSFTFIVKDADGQETRFSLKSYKKCLEGALLDEGLIEGEEGPYGLYVKRVNGILADYDINGAYWKLIVNGKESMVGASSVEIKEGDVYSYEYAK